MKKMFNSVLCIILFSLLLVSCERTDAPSKEPEQTEPEINMTTQSVGTEESPAISGNTAAVPSAWVDFGENILWREDFGVYDVNGRKLVDGEWITAASESEAMEEYVSLDDGELEISLDIEAFLNGKKFADNKVARIAVRVFKNAEYEITDKEEQGKAFLYTVAKALLYTRDERCTEMEKFNVCDWVRYLGEKYKNAVMTEGEIDFDKIEASLPLWKSASDSLAQKIRSATSAADYAHAFEDQGVQTIVLRDELFVILSRDDFDAGNGCFAFDIGDCRGLRCEVVSKDYLLRVLNDA